MIRMLLVQVLGSYIPIHMVLKRILSLIPSVSGEPTFVGTNDSDLQRQHAVTGTCTINMRSCHANSLLPPGTAPLAHVAAQRL